MSEEKDLYEGMLAKAATLIPGACVGQVLPYPAHGPIFVRGLGSRVWDTRGGSYIDFAMGSGPMFLGHAHPEVVEAVRAQASQGSTFYALTPPAVQLAEKIVQASSAGDAIRFQTTGAEATQAAIRIARAATERQKIIKFNGSWHGTYDIALTSVGAGGAVVADSAGLPHSATTDILIAEYNDESSLQQLLHANAGDVAAIIVEPVQRGIVPADGFLNYTKAAAERAGVLLIFDEVVTGFRLAWGGAQELYGVKPDLACYGKVIGGGYPISAVVGARELVSLGDPVNKGSSKYVFMGGTLTGNPVSSAAGLATLEILQRSSPYAAVNQLAGGFADGIRDAAVCAGVHLHVTQVGSIIQLYFGDIGLVKNAGDAARADLGAGKTFAKLLLERGIFTVPNAKFYVSVAHSSEDIDQTLESVRFVLKRM